MSTNDPHHIIAIGASAGGMDELNSFFDHTPLDGVSYIIVQHLSPDFKSRMVELLSKHSKLAVKEAENEMPIRSNEVYLIPNDKFMTIRGKKLYLTNKEKGHGPSLTINTFFNSLAADCGEKAIGIVLSGLGSDGSEGIKAIKAAGGMVIARNPETSEFSSMPSNAIATGMVDYILEPALMPDTIEDYVKNEEEISEDIKNEEKNLLAIIELIKERTPLDFSDYKQSTILRRIKRRAGYNNFTRLVNYLEFLKSSPGEIKTLSQDFLIGVTSFFRDIEAFDFIETDVIPGILKSLAPGEELKMWVAGCATGEEAYSLAILACEQLKNNYKDVIVKIFATDIDTVALLHAGKGIYTSAITNNISAERLEKHFIKEGDNYRVKPDIRKMVIFAQHDLVKNPPYCNMHFISCRNLLIYMTPPLQKKIFFMLLFGLKKGAYLFLGSSENPITIIQNLEVVNKKWKIYKNLESKRIINYDGFSLPRMLDIKDRRTGNSTGEIPKNINNFIAEAVNATLVKEMDILAICIDEENNVLKTYGDTTKYLLQKNFNSNLPNLLPRPLGVAFNSLAITAKKTNEKVTVKGIKVKTGETVTKINISVSPVDTGHEKQFLIVELSEEKLASPATGNELVYDEKIYLDKYTLILEQELAELKEKLESTYQQLDRSNDNMQSFNEELLSANEEMQSTNEEMQSVNEELHTINADYQLKNKELLELNDDLNNYFRSNINGQLFVNNDLRLMKFSPGAVNQINLLPSDVGRPLSNISTNIKFETIVADIQLVLFDGRIITKEIETSNGRWYQIMTMPYLMQADNKTNGAVITFNDITALKKIQLELDKKNISLLRINSDLENFVHTASHDLIAPLSNIETSIDVMNELQITDPQLKTFFNIIHSSVKKFRSLINDIASVAKVESELIPMEMIDLGEIIDNVEWSLENKIKSSGAIVSKDLHTRYIRFSKKNIRSILFNLISNAIKFKSDRHPEINIKTITTDDNVILTIQDNGIGISKEDIDKIFGKYNRLDPDVEGQGIGLYLARKIVDASGGNITVESEPGVGSKFSIFFKAEPERIITPVSLN
jgi:two-component system CheB/CheR fusion protein